MTQYASELADFSDLLRATAQERGIPAAIVEKDYYLTTALRALAEGHDNEFVLKGGTSLSKGWQLLERFSEDIDLLLRDDGRSGKAARHKLLKGCAQTIEGTRRFESQQTGDSETGVHRTVIFTYPSVANDLPGLGKTVILEAGYRGSTAGAVKHQVQSMVAEFAAARGHKDIATDLSRFELEVQCLERTFVEKLFAAHAAYTKDYARGKARHYYDLYELCKRPEVSTFAGTKEYRQCVAEVCEFCRRTFQDQALPQSESFAASPAFQPDSAGLRELERSYTDEGRLFFGKQPPLAEVLKVIGQLLSRL